MQGDRMKNAGYRDGANRGQTALSTRNGAARAAEKSLRLGTEWQPVGMKFDWLKHFCGIMFRPV